MEEGKAPSLSAVELYTRGQPGENENRGESMVQKHAEKMQKEKEEKQLAAIAQTLPNIGKLTHVLALQETDWDLDEAVLLLRQFQMENLERLNSLQKKRKQLLDEAAGQLAQGGGPDAPSADHSSGSDGDDSSSDGDREEARKKKKRSREDSEERSKSRKKSKKSSKPSSKKKKSSKSSKKKQKDSSPKPAAKRQLTHSEDFGKYGILRETDIFEKQSEFLLWCREVKGQNIDTLGRHEEKDMFREYMEDYNTGTLPHKKYYDLEAYEKYKAAKALHKQHKRGDTTEKAVEKVSFNDEEELRRARMLERAKQQADRLEEAYKELRNTSKAEDMREQEMLRMQMALAYKTGDRTKAQQLLERLKPDDQKKDEEKRLK